MAQCSCRLRRLILLARPDQTTNNYYRNFKWQRGKSVTPTLRLGGASVWFIHNPNAINICYSFHVHVQRVPGAGFSER